LRRLFIVNNVDGLDVHQQRIVAEVAALRALAVRWSWLIGICVEPIAVEKMRKIFDVA